MPDLPQIVIPAVLYNALLVSLGAAASWHAISLVQAFFRSRQSGPQ